MVTLTKKSVRCLHVRLDGNRWLWHQEVNNTVIPGSESKAPRDASPWLVLRFNTVDGENYGHERLKSRDFKSLDALSKPWSRAALQLLR